VELFGLTVRNFRNLASLDLELPPKGVVILGDNGQGKTNLLEAIYYLVLFRSLRGAKDRELVRFGEEGFFVGGKAAGGAFEVRAGYESAGRRKKISLDGNAVARISDAVGKILAVSFAPSDRVIVAGPASGRRRYLDVLLSLAEPGYLAWLSEQRAALKQRNAALRRNRGDEAQGIEERRDHVVEPAVPAHQQSQRHADHRGEHEPAQVAFDARSQVALQRLPRERRAEQFHERRGDLPRRRQESLRRQLERRGERPRAEEDREPREREPGDVRAGERSVHAGRFSCGARA